MHKIEILIGSPRKRGNTSLMAGMLNDGLNTAKYTSNIKYPYDFEIKPCADYRGCIVFYGLSPGLERNIK